MALKLGERDDSDHFGIESGLVSSGGTVVWVVHGGPVYLSSS